MRKSNSALVLFIFVMFVSMILGIVFADNEEYEEEITISDVMIEPEFTTVFAGDIIELNIGLNEKPYGNSAYISFDKNIFELDLSNIKSVNDGVNYKKYDVKENGHMVTYIFYYDIGNYNNNYKINYGFSINDEDEKKLLDVCYKSGCDIIDGVVDSILFDNIYLKVKDDVKVGHYLIESGDFDSTESNFIPITIIDNINNSNTLNKALEYNEVIHNKERNINLVSCNNRCRVIGIGSSGYVFNNNFKHEEYSLYYIIFNDDEKYLYDSKKANIKMLPNISFRHDFVPNYEYTTIYQNDVINVSLDKTMSYFRWLMYDERDKSNYILSEEGNYVLIPLYFEFEKNVFELDLSDLKVSNDNIIYKGFEKKEKGNSVVYKLNFEMKNIQIDLKSSEFEKDFITGIKLLSKKNSSLGKHYIYFDLYYNYYEPISEQMFYFKEFSEFNIDLYDFMDEQVISIVDKNKSDKSLNSVIAFYDDSDYENYFEVDVSEKKNDYSFNKFELPNEFVSNLYVDCNQKCYFDKWKNFKKLNHDYVFDYDDVNYNIEVLYDDGSMVDYVFTNESNSKIYSPIFHEWGEDNVIIFGNGPEENYGYINKIKTFVEKYKSYNEVNYTYSYYDVSKMSKEDKDYISKFSLIDFNKELPYIFMYRYYYNEELTNGLDHTSDESYGELTDKELESFVADHFGLYIYFDESSKEQNNVVNDSVDDIEDYSNDRNYKAVAIVLFCSFIILVLIVVVCIIVHKKKKKVMESIDNKRSDGLEEKSGEVENDIDKK